MQIAPTLDRSFATKPKIIDLRTACVAHYKLNDNAASTVVIDSQGFSNGTAQQNTSALFTTGKIGGALSFNGTSDYVTITPTVFPSGASARTVSLWCYTDNVPDAGCLFIYGDYGSNHLFGLSYYDYGRMAIARGTLGSGTIHIDTGDVNQILSSWTNWILTYDGTNIRLYANSVLVWTSNTITLATGTDIAKIGMAYDVSEYPFPGLIDNVMIFDKALSLDEIRFLYNAGNGTEYLNGVI